MCNALWLPVYTYDQSEPGIGDTDQWEVSERVMTMNGPRQICPHSALLRYPDIWDIGPIRARYWWHWPIRAPRHLRHRDKPSSTPSYLLEHSWLWIKMVFTTSKDLHPRNHPSSSTKANMSVAWLGESSLLISMITQTEQFHHPN